MQFAYHSNRIEGSKLTEEQTCYIFETRTIGFKEQEAVPVDDIIETTNHFVAFDHLLRTIADPLSEELIKEFHRILKTGTADAQKPYFNVGGKSASTPLLNIIGDLRASTRSRMVMVVSKSNFELIEIEAEQDKEIQRLYKEWFINLHSQLRLLTEARDRLLPKLMSGEIEV